MGLVPAGFIAIPPGQAPGFDHADVYLGRAEAPLLYVAHTGADRVDVYRCRDEKLLARIRVGDRPNGLAYDARRQRLFCFNLGEPIGENCTASVVDLAQGDVTETIPLPGRPRWAVFDPE